MFRPLHVGRTGFSRCGVVMYIIPKVMYSLGTVRVWVEGRLVGERAYSDSHQAWDVFEAAKGCLNDVAVSFNWQSGNVSWEYVGGADRECNKP